MIFCSVDLVSLFQLVQAYRCFSLLLCGMACMRRLSMTVFNALESHLDLIPTETRIGYWLKASGQHCSREKSHCTCTCGQVQPSSGRTALF